MEYTATKKKKKAKQRKQTKKHAHKCEGFQRVYARRREAVEKMSQCLFLSPSTEVNAIVHLYLFVQNYCKWSLVKKLLSLKIIIVTQSFRWISAGKWRRLTSSLTDTRSM